MLIIKTSNMTSITEVTPKRKCTSVCCYMASPGEYYYNTLLCCHYFSSSSVVSRTFSALCMYSTFGHHSHPWVTFVPNLVSFDGSIAELAHGEKSCIQSINHSIILSPSLFDAPGTVSLRKTNLM